MTVTPQTNTDLASIAEALKAHDDFVVCGHVSPDGDCRARSSAWPRR